MSASVTVGKSRTMACTVSTLYEQAQKPQSIPCSVKFEAKPVKKTEGNGHNYTDSMPGQKIESLNWMGHGY
jgi:hypothetical protein